MEKENSTAKKIIVLSGIAILLVILIGFVSCQNQGSGSGTGTSTTTTEAGVTTSTSEETTQGVDTTNAPESSTEVTTTQAPTSTETPEEGETPEAEKYVTVSLSSTDVYTGSLIWVNAQSPYCYKVASLLTPTELDKLSTSELAELGWASLYAGKNGNYLLRSRLIYLKSEAYAAFSLMMNSFVAKTGMRDVQVRYGYQLLNSATDAASLSDERVTGLVVELNVYTDEGTFSIDHTSKKNVYYEWFATNCYKYGFVMTGESGYFRYVGLPHAAYMVKNGYDLDDYLAVLSGYSYDKPLAVSDADGVLWNVYFVRASSESLTDVKIRENSVYVISGNNRDGFIVASRDK